MARERERRRTPKESTRRTKKKVCIFCKEHIEWVDYKDVNLLRRFMSDRGKIRARRVSGNCAQHQRDVAVAVKTARELALLPYTQRAVNERGPSRGRREDRGVRPPRDVEAEAPVGVLEEVELEGVVDLDEEAGELVGEELP
jgi:small subunit ribosomal protein S18